MPSTVTLDAAPPLASRRLMALGRELDTGLDALGELRVSSHLAGDGDALRERMASDGYLFLPGYLDRAEVLEARRETVARIERAGLLDSRFPAMEAVAAPNCEKKYFMPELAHGNQPLLRLLYAGRMMAFYETLLGGAVRHFDYTWMRAVSPGGATAPHCDIVYMGRGTKNLFTAWTPLSDIAYPMGGLMILENSHRNERLKANYGSRDVDTHCTNHHDMRETGSSTFGALSSRPDVLRARLGGRWLTAPEFKMGDLLTFSMFTVHASLDNNSDRIRLSSDTRYQLASEPADERWIGENPIAHGPNAKRQAIC